MASSTPGTRSATTRWLSRAPAPLFSAWTGTAAFATYFCMYAYRKAFAVGIYAGAAHLPLLPPVELKILFITAQAFGYALSKFLGVKIISEMTPSRRALAIFVLVGFAELGLGVFGALPAPWSAIGMLLNGLPLGMVWGLVFGVLEGRRLSDVLGAMLCASFIVASGFVKTVGAYLLGAGVPERWMPAATGLLFFPPLALFVWMLAQVPPPDAEDERQRTRRVPMDAEARRRFFRAWAPGLVALVLAYVFLSAYRDFRDNFAREIWDALGFAGAPSVLTTAELPVAFGALVAVALMMAIRDSRRALLVIHALMLGGALLTGLSTALFSAGRLSPAAWMICVGLGLYVGYVPFNCVLFDRLIAAVGSAATAGFLIYVADSFGYLGSVGVLLYKNFGLAELPWLRFFVGFSYAAAGVSAVFFVLSGLYFRARLRPRRGVDVTA